MLFPERSRAGDGASIFFLDIARAMLLDPVGTCLGCQPILYHGAKGGE